MKIKQDYVLRQVADTWVVLPLGETSVDFHGMLSINESGAMLWKALEQGCTREQLAAVLTREYAVEQQQALEDVDEFIAKLSGIGCIEQ